MAAFVPLPVGYRSCYGVTARIVILLAHLPVLGSRRWPALVSPLITLQLLTMITMLLLPLLVLLGVRGRKWPSERPPSPSCSDSAGQHVVLVSHYRESQFIVERTLRALDAASSRAAWPVAVVHAVEADAPLVAQGWDLSSVTANFRPYLVAVHERGAPGERPGLGSNLRNAVRFVAEETSIPVPGTMLSKLDGNAVVPEDFFATLEVAWCRAGCSDLVAFQTGVHEIGHEEWKSLDLLCRLHAYFAGLLHHKAVTVCPCTGFHSSFCLSLATVLRAGSWDPWLIQGDNVLCHRAVLATRGRLRVRLLPSSVFNPPALSYRERVQQCRRRVVHTWYGLGFALCHLWGAKASLGFGFPIHQSLALARIPLLLVLSPWIVPATIEAWAAESLRPEVLFLSIVLCCLAILSPAWAARRWEPAMLLMPCVFVENAWMEYFHTLCFLFFARDARESYTTTNTLNDVGRGGEEGEDLITKRASEKSKTTSTALYQLRSQ